MKGWSKGLRRMYRASGVMTVLGTVALASSGDEEWPGNFVLFAVGATLYGLGFYLQGRGHEATRLGGFR
jgi:hypothetical protein